MSSKGHYRAEVLRVCLRDDLTEPVIKQLENILHEQFKEENYREIGGVALYRNDWLHLETVSQPEIQQVEEALTKFSQGDYSGLEKLSVFAEKAVDFHEKHHGRDWMLNALKLYFKAAYVKSMEKPRELSLSEEVRREWEKRYKELLRHYTVVPLHEYVDKKYFLGWFHVHPSGTGPSPADINSSAESDLPALVFSALASYQQTGVEIYLLRLGKVELLYQGLLESTKKE